MLKEGRCEMMAFPIRTMGRGLLAALVIWASAALPGSAQDRVVVVELYTSQGCSACPPADSLLSELADRPGVVALALHVDYWDYIGWKDIFARPAHTERQKSYAYAKGKSMVYTPQIVIDGTDHIVGSKPMQVADLIAAHAERITGVELSAEREGTSLRVSARAAPGVRGPMAIYLVRYTPRAEVEIDRGENAGRRLAYSNIVTEFHEIARWSGETDLAIRAEIAGDARVAVLVQEIVGHDGPGPMRAAVAVE